MVLVRDHYITAQLDPTSGYKNTEMNIRMQLDNRDRTSGKKTIKVKVTAPDSSMVGQEEVNEIFLAID